MNENGDEVEDVGLTDPEPFSVIVTLVALPPNTLPLTVIGEVPQVLPLELVRVTVAGFAQPHDTKKLVPVEVHPDEFLTVMVCVPLAMPVNTLLPCNVPPSILYW